MKKPAILLTDLPWNVKKGITSSTDLKTRMSLRKCSKEFRRIVKYLPTTYYTLELEMYRDSICFKFTDNNEKHVFNWSNHKCAYKNKQCIRYHFHTEGCVIRDGEWEKLIEGANHIELAVRDFETFVSKPNVKVDILHLSMRPNSYMTHGKFKNDFGFDDAIKLMKQDVSLFLKLLCRSLERIRGKLWTRHFETEIICEQEELLQVLQNLRPGTLEAINICRFGRGHEIGNIIETEQWKKAKTVVIFGSRVPAAALLSFSKILTDSVKFSAEDIISFVNAALKHGESFQHADFNCCDYNYDDFLDYLLPFPRLPGDEDAWKVQIPASEWYLKVTIYKDSVSIAAVDPFKPEDPEPPSDPHASFAEYLASL